MQQIYYRQTIPIEYEGMLDTHAILPATEDLACVFDCYHDDPHAAMSFVERWKERSWLKRNLLSGKKVRVFSSYTADQISKHYPKASANLIVQQPRVDEAYHPIDDDAKDIVRYNLTNGEAYFLYRGPIHPAASLTELLKGFSIFKKKMGSNMKLVLCGPISKKGNSFLHSIESYKYRDDLVLRQSFSDDTELMAAAYALIHPCRWERFGFSVLKAMKAGVAVLTAADSAMSEFCSMAGMYFNEKDPNDIGEKLIRIYKDEQMRQEMIGTGLSKSL
jgi:glycosyltransferase involved in cell wall biosynthesis